MIKIAPLISELRKTDLTTGLDTEYLLVVVYKGYLFLLDEESKLDKLKAVVKDHPEFQKPYPKKALEEQTDVFEFITLLAESGGDITTGVWYPEKKGLIIWGQSEVIPQTSLNVKKAAKALGAKTVTYQHYNYSYGGDIEDTDLPTKKITGKIPKIMYHGTSSEELHSILVYGLDPDRGPSRFKHRGVEHPGHIFVAATMEAAQFYADHAVRSTQHEKQKESYPVIVELELPDENLLTPDYDADLSMVNKPHYKHGDKTSITRTSMKSMGVSRETGKWGYKGRIPAKFIKWVYYYNTYQKKWHKSRPDVWRKVLNRHYNDWETIAYKLGMDNYLKPEDRKITQYWS